MLVQTLLKSTRHLPTPQSLQYSIICHIQYIFCRWCTKLCSFVAWTHLQFLFRGGGGELTCIVIYLSLCLCTTTVNIYLRWKKKVCEFELPDWQVGWASVWAWYTRDLWLSEPPFSCSVSSQPSMYISYYRKISVCHWKKFSIHVVLYFSAFFHKICEQVLIYCKKF